MAMRERAEQPIIETRSLRLKALFSTLAVASCLALAGCGGGGGGGAAGGGSSAKLRLKLAGTATNGGVAKAVQATVTLPDGVTVKASPAGDLDPTTAAASGVAPLGALFASHYRAAAAGQAGSVTMALVSTSGLSSGEFAFIVCDIAAGKSVTAADFALSDQQVVNDQGAVPGLTIALTLD